MRLIDLTDKKFERLTVRWPAGLQGNKIVWLCSCECGKLTLVSGTNIREGHTTSCGCLHREVATANHLIHGHNRRDGRKDQNSPSPTYRSWAKMIERCTNSNHIHWKNYGGRGIAVCDRWRNSFKEFLADMGMRPDGLTLDRINNEGNYEPGNCRWATREQQNTNSRRCKQYVRN